MSRAKRKSAEPRHLWLLVAVGAVALPAGLLVRAVAALIERYPLHILSAMLLGIYLLAWWHG